jgi:hypothetical protein
MLINKLNVFQLTLVAIVSITLTACGNDDNNDSMTSTPSPVMEYGYEVTVTNLTYGQPLSPITVTLHGNTKMWQVGMSASTAIEMLAEGGDNSSLINLDGVVTSSSTQAPLAPGLTETVSITTTETMATHLTVATMLVNTNDAFSGLTGLELASLVVDSPQSWTLPVYDAGTEKNSESIGTIPGPADGGTGFDALRDDIDLVAMHPGVVSQDDGLSNSVLTQVHRFDNPSIKLTITRTK